MNYFILDNLLPVDISKCNQSCPDSSDACGGEGGYVSVYGEGVMQPGTPKKVTFDVELNIQVRLLVFLYAQAKCYNTLVVPFLH